MDMGRHWHVFSPPSHRQTGQTLFCIVPSSLGVCEGRGSDLLPHPTLPHPHPQGWGRGTEGGRGTEEKRLLSLISYLPIPYISPLSPEPPAFLHGVPFFALPNSCCLRFISNFLPLYQQAILYTVHVCLLCFSSLLLHGHFDIFFWDALCARVL